MENNKSKILKQLFLSTFYLSACTFGGGYVIVTLLKKKFVDQLNWIDENEMYDLIAIAQSSPGAVAVNGAIVVGYKLAGIPGVCVSVLGAILPPIFIIMVLSYFYNLISDNPLVSALLQGMRVGVGAIILSAVYDMGKKIVVSHDIFLIFIMIISLFCGIYFQINSVLMIIAALVIGIVRSLITGRRKKV